MKSKHGKLEDYRQSDFMDFPEEENFDSFDSELFGSLEEDLDELWRETHPGDGDGDDMDQSLSQTDWGFGSEPSQSKPKKGKSSIPSCVAAYCKEASKYELLDAQEEAELARRIAAGDEQAFDKLVTANLRLVISIAGKIYRKQMDSSPFILLELEDLISIGDLGLFKAARKFDPSKARFSTYAYRWIKQEILRRIHTEDSEIHLSEQAGSAVSRVRRFKWDFYEANGHYPTEAEIAEGLNMSITQIRNVFSAEATANPAHLDSDVTLKESSSEDSEIDLYEVTSIRSVETTEQKVEKRMSIQWVLDYLHGRGNARDEEIFIRYSGILNDGEGETLAVIAESVGLSKERVRQIYNGLREEIRELLIPESQK